MSLGFSRPKFSSTGRGLLPGNVSLCFWEQIILKASIVARLWSDQRNLPFPRTANTWRSRVMRPTMALHCLTVSHTQAPEAKTAFFTTTGCPRIRDGRATRFPLGVFLTQFDPCYTRFISGDNPGFYTSDQQHQMRQVQSTSSCRPPVLGKVRAEAGNLSHCRPLV